MGGLIGAMVVGLMLVVFLIVSNNNNNPSTPSQGSAQNPGGSINTGATTAPNQASTGDTPPRMPIEEFKKLYDDPANRPMIIDVRPTEAYVEGHIAGAVSIPESEVDIVLPKIPRDKLVVAYCQ
jgi:3-mercaptopyruvate sulfurtransferase SseA